MFSVLCIYFETVVSYKRTHGQFSVLRSSGRFSYQVSFILILMARFFTLLLRFNVDM